MIKSLMDHDGSRALTGYGLFRSPAVHFSLFSLFDRVAATQWRLFLGCMHECIYLYTHSEIIAMETSGVI
jgi:hypothetical protein